MPIMNSEANSIIKVIRSIVQSRKDPIPMNDITRDFKALEGSLIPFRKFGYQTLEDFLKCSGEFNFRRYGGEVKVFVIPSQESQHIMKMISKQKSNKTKSGGGFFPIAQAPKRKTTMTGSNWNRSAYAQNYSKMPTPTKQHSQASYQVNNYNNRVNTLNNSNYKRPQPLINSYQQQLHQQQQQQQQQQMNRHILGMIENSLRSSISNNNNINYNIPYNKPRVEPPKKTSSPPPIQQTFVNPLPRQTPIPKQLPTPQKQSAPPLLPQKQAAPPLRQAPSLPQKQAPSLPQKQAPQLPQRQYVQVTGSSVAQRLLRPTAPLQIAAVAEPPKPKTPSGQETNNNTNNVKNMNLANNDLRLKLIQSSVDNSTVDPKTTNQTLATFKPADYREDPIVKPKKKAVSMPKIEILSKQSLQDRLNINQKEDPVTEEAVSPVVTPEPFSWTKNANSISELAKYCSFHIYEAPQYKYFSLPEKRVNCRVTINKIIYGDYPKDYATISEAQLGAALAAVISIQGDECDYKYDLVKDNEIVPKLYELLKQTPNGIFRKKIPEMFQEMYQMSLPESWFKSIAQNHKFLVEELIKDNEIIFIDNGDVKNPTFKEKDSKIGKLLLPWDEQHWNLYITNPISTREIWARLVGPEYSDKMDELITEIEMQTFDKTKQPETLELNCHYLCYFLESWHRVRIDDISTEDGHVYCFFIDHGDSEWVSMAQIYECSPEFLQLPGQAICFALDGLEDLEGNPNAKTHLAEELGTKIVIGEVLTNKEELSSEEFDGSIRVVLYDTSSDIDVNLNPVILKRICDDIPTPTLDRKLMNYVTITYVDDDAFTYCQVQNSSMPYLQNLINNLVQSNALEKKHQGLYVKGDKLGLYLIFDAKDKKWYRARIVSAIKENYTMFCVDHGFQKVVSLSNIYRLDALSVALLRYPEQAIKTQQYNLPEINEYILGRLKGLLKQNINAMMRVFAISKNIPEVKTYLRSEIDKIPFCVTDVINLESDIYESKDQDLSDHRMKPNSSLTGSSTTGESLKGNASSDYNKSDAVHLQPIPKFPLPELNEIFNVIITIASSPSYFIVQPYNCSVKLNDLMIQLQNDCKSQELLRPDQLKVGEYYAGWSEEDEAWYRVQVDNIIVDQCISVRLVDYGRVFVLDGTKHLKPLTSSFRELPQQAVKAKLYGVKPINGDWTADDAVHFSKITSNRNFAAIVKHVQKDEINHRDQVVMLRLVDVSTKDDVYMDNILAEEGRAILID